jgi:hypothetical protein
MRYPLRTLFTFTIRDVLFMTAIVGLALAWMNDRIKWAAERDEMIRQRDAAVDNERRLGELRALEAAGRVISVPVKAANPKPLLPSRPR